MTDPTMHPIQPILELTVLFPAAFLCFLATADHLRIKKHALALIAALVLTLVCLLGGGLCWYMQWAISTLLPLLLVFLAAAFCRLVALSVWKSISIFLGVCAALTCYGVLACTINHVISPGSIYTPWLCCGASLIQFGLCWVQVALVWYPATHAVRKLLQEEAIVRTWYVFWVLPVVFILFNLFILPKIGENMGNGRLFSIYITLSLMTLGLLHLFYLLFYLMAQELNANTRLRQENQFLHMQTAQYDALRSAINETRQARHDLHHHFNALSALAGRGAWEDLRRYLADVQSNIPAAELGLCENPAVDGVAGYYAALSRQNGISFTCRLDLPHTLPVSEMDVCVVLANLLENALEASQRADCPAFIQIRASLHGGKLVLLTVENAYTGKLLEQNGVLQSSKRKGEGMGLQSVIHIAEKNGGYCRFLYGNNVFTANVMLRGGG